MQVYWQTPNLSIWNLPASSPPLFKYEQLANWSLVNPLLYVQLNSTRPTKGPPGTTIMGLTEIGSILVQTEQLYFVNDSDTAESSLPDAALTWLFESLKYVTKQPQLTHWKPYVHEYRYEITELPRINLVEHSNPDSGFVQMYVWKDQVANAITLEDLQNIGSLPTSFQCETYDDVMLNALSAFASGDYRFTILFAAMALEVFILSWLDSKYRLALDSHPRENTMRIVSNQPSGMENEALIDPVYELMCARKPSFRELLHERPLYLSNRSLLIENKILYDDALKIYKARNSITHSGTMDEQHSIRIDRPGALFCVETAIKILKWFGESGNYLPRLGFEKVMGTMHLLKSHENIECITKYRVPLGKKDTQELAAFGFTLKIHDGLDFKNFPPQDLSPSNPNSNS